MAIQMGVIIGLFAYLGYWLDHHYLTRQPYFTIVFSLVGVTVALFTATRDFIKRDK